MRSSARWHGSTAEAAPRAFFSIKRLGAMNLAKTTKDNDE